MRYVIYREFDRWLSCVHVNGTTWGIYWSINKIFCWRSISIVLLFVASVNVYPLCWSERPSSDFFFFGDEWNHPSPSYYRFIYFSKRKKKSGGKEHGNVLEKKKLRYAPMHKALPLCSSFNRSTWIHGVVRVESSVTTAEKVRQESSSLYRSMPLRHLHSWACQVDPPSLKIPFLQNCLSPRYFFFFLSNIGIVSYL